MRTLRLIYIIVAVASLVLVGLGGYVRGTGAGLACPDWPLCYGRVIPQDFAGGVFQEWLHRILAKSVGVLIIAAVALSYTLRVKYRQAWLFSLAMLVLVIAQGVLGGLTVLMTLNPFIVTAHLAFGTIFFQLVALVAIERNRPSPVSDSESAPFRNKVAILSGLVFLQMVLGGFVGSSGASLACPRFPYCPGIFDTANAFGPRIIVSLHGLIGTLILIFAVVLLRTVNRSRGASRQRRGHVIGINAMIGLQVLLGIGAIHLRIPVAMAVLHLALAQLILLALTSLWRDLSDNPKLKVLAGDEKVRDDLVARGVRNSLASPKRAVM